MTDIQGHGKVENGRAIVTLDFGFGTLTLDVDQASLSDDEKAEIFVNVISNADDAIATVFDALIEKSEAVDD